MRFSCRVVAVLWLFAALGRGAAADTDPLQPWRAGVSVHPVVSAAGQHTIHSYYLACPESPDGRQVLYFTSTRRDGQTGELRILDRASQTEKTIARNIETEDGHRAACQQWTCGGSRIAFHDVRGGRWGVYVIDLATEKETALLDWQIGFGQPASSVLPVYGCHWNPGEHRGLGIMDAITGQVREALGIAKVQQDNAQWIASRFGEKPISIFFPILSPDGKSAFFKIAAGAGGSEFRSGKASQREGLLAYNLEGQQLLMARAKWGHPAWHPDSQHIIEVGNLLFDTHEGGKTAAIPNLPVPGGCHLSMSQEGTLFVMDGSIERLGGKPGEWGVIVCDIRGGEGRYQILHRFDNSRGVKSWRKNHPHPVFSADGRRIYFNVNQTDWTQLFVAERQANTQ